MKYIQVVITASTKDEALKIADTAVSQRVAACAQVTGPITSVFWWQGKIDKADEWYCVLKSREDLFPRLESVVRSVHSYEVPEILATPILLGSETYLKWMEKELGERS